MGSNKETNNNNNPIYPSVDPNSFKGQQPYQPVEQPKNVP